MDMNYTLSFIYHALAAMGNVEMLKNMLDQSGPASHGSTLRHLDPMGRTPLLAAVQNGQADAIKLLVQYGSDVEEEWGDEDGFKMLHMAVLCEQPDSVRALVEAGVDPDQRTGRGFTALHAAARMGQLETARVLLEVGAAVDALGPDGSTPLCWATLNGHAKTAELLLQHGSDPNIAGIRFAAVPGINTMMTPLYVAAVNNNTGLVHILIRHGADPNHPNCQGPGGHTSLHEAARTGNFEAARALIEAGIDAHVMAQDGTLAFQWAERMGNQELARYILEAMGEPGSNA